MVFARPTIKKIRSLATEQSFERGVGYFEDNSVMSAAIEHDTISCVVSGTELYDVSISMHDSYNCTCPYDYGGICKHIVAALLYTSRHYTQMKKDAENNKEMIDGLLSKVPEKELGEFLRGELLQNADLRTKLVKHFEKDYTIPNRDYKSEINLLFRNVTRDGMIEYDEIDYERFTMIAKSKEKKGDYLGACEIYRDLSEAIADYMDPTGLDYEDFAGALASMVSCISAQRLSHKEKRQHISYLLDRCIEDFDHRRDYTLALERVCKGEDDYSYLLGLLKPHLPRKILDGNGLDSHRARSNVLMHIHILERLHKPVQGVYTAHYRNDEDICISFIKHLKNDPKRLPQIIRTALQCHPESKKLIDVVIPACKDKRCHGVVLDLYLETLEQRYYSCLRSMPNWKKTFAKITKYMKHKPELVELYLAEGMHAQALRLITSRRDLASMYLHRKRLAYVCPHKYFEAYRLLLLEFVHSSTKKSQYRKVRKHLGVIKRIPGHKKKFASMLDQLRERHSTKPAFLQSLKGI